MFETILGNKSAKTYLQKALQEDRLPHALLFAGPAGIGKSLFAQEIASHLLDSPLERIEKKTHPDFHALFPEGKSGIHSIETLRHLIDDVHAMPFEGVGKVFVIYDAERMQPAAANALLKTLEEPSPLTTLFLLTSRPQDILPTIQSRCSKVHFHPLAESEIVSLLKNRGVEERYALGAQGSIGKALELAEKKHLEEDLFSFFENSYSDVERMQCIEKIEKAIEDEDPLKHSRQIEHVLSCILMWDRDQIARNLKIPEEKLFFPNAPAAKAPIFDLARIESIVEEARLALSRNIRFSVCLEKIFSSI